MGLFALGPFPRVPHQRINEIPPHCSQVASMSCPLNSSVFWICRRILHNAQATPLHDLCYRRIFRVLSCFNALLENRLRSGMQIRVTASVSNRNHHSLTLIIELGQINPYHNINIDQDIIQAGTQRLVSPPF